MAEATTNAHVSPLLERQHRAFLLRKLHSLTGVVPVGAFLLEHLWTNAKALHGQAHFDSAVSEINHLPYLWALEVFGIFLPLAFHALYGVKVAFESHPNVARYTYTRNWMYTLQRVTGIVALAFILYHLWEFRVAKLMGTMTADAFYPTLCAHLSSTGALGVPWVALFYLVGIGATVLHFANGLFGFCFSWGITVSRRAQRLAAATFGVLGIALFVFGANTVFYFATGARFFLPSDAGADTAGQCDVAPPANASPPAPAAVKAAP